MRFGQALLFVITPFVITFTQPASLAAQPLDPASGNPDTGAEIFDYCSGCHQLGRDAENGIGPHLNGLFDRPAGAIDGFAYSKSMMRAAHDGLKWDYTTLDAYIENPKNLISGTRMSFDGLEDPVERADLMAYLRLFSADPANIPEAAPTASDAGHDLDPAILALKGDPAYGEYLSSECVTCHQTSGADLGVPSITLWPEDDFVIAMHAYRRKLRPHPVMQMVAGRLNDEEIAALAAYFAQLTP
ncbi:MAG: c-type cytochrome [Mangrovicoccus sp.]